MHDISKIRNFAIIAHIDHGKSTLADRMLEITNTIEKRKLKDQTLDSMELERERGITIKMAPVRMEYKGHVLNLIDTPGHIDFSYEVSRALSAIEGVVLLVDASQGIEAQTMSVLEMAKKQNLKIIPALSKIDLPHAQTQEQRLQLAITLGVEEEDVILTSGKTGEGVQELLDKIITQLPPPKPSNDKNKKALIFDFQYSDHKGIIVYTRIFSGSFKKRDGLFFLNAGVSFKAIEVGVFSPDPEPVPALQEGEIGYIVTGIKKPGIARVGDTISEQKSATPLPGYEPSIPVVWASVYPESQDDFGLLAQSLEKLRLTDSAIVFEEESSNIIGRGFKIGFLGMLHMEIVTERLKREFGLNIIVTSPSVSYDVELKNGEKKTIYTAAAFPEHGEIKQVYEQIVEVEIIVPHEYVGEVMTLFQDYEAITTKTEKLLDSRVKLTAKMPLRELMRNFFDALKSKTSGMASLAYREIGKEVADVVKLDVLIAEESVPAFARIVSAQKLKNEAEKVVEKLYDVMPRQQFVLKIQAKAQGKIIASRKKSAYRKDVTAKLYGGDVTRKMKLLEKQKKGKKKALAQGKVHIPENVFTKMMKAE